MTDKNTLDFVSLQFKDGFLRFMASDAYFPSFLKCMLVGLAVWSPGVLAAHVSGTLSMYISDVVHLVWDIAVGLALFLTIRLCRQVDSTLREIDGLVQHSRNEDFPRFVGDWNKSSRNWYYFCAVGPIAWWVVGDLLHVFVPSLIHGPVSSWVNEDIVGWEAVRLNMPYVVFEHVVYGLVIGICANRFLHYLLFIRDYNERFLSRTRPDLLFQNVASELRPLGRLALESSLVITLPLCLSSTAFFQNYIQAIQTGKNPISYTYLSSIVGFVVMLLLTVVFQVKYPRQVLLNAKKRSLSYVDNVISELRSRVEKDLSSLSTLSEMHTLRESLSKTSLWILDSRLLSRFFLTVFLPILGGATIQIVMEHLLESTL